MSDAWDGRPENSEVSGWHWLAHTDLPADEIAPAYWAAGESDWDHPWRPDPIPAHHAARIGYRYLGPCAPPGAEFRRGWEAAREAAALIARRAEQNCQHAAIAEWGYSDSPGVRARIEARGNEAGRIAAAIRAIEPPA